jgi:hypothetical protein
VATLLDLFNNRCSGLFYHFSHAKDVLAGAIGIADLVTLQFCKEQHFIMQIALQNYILS